MKIFFGHNCTDESRVSLALKDKGISLLRASPSEIPLVGLFRISQPGYEFYSANLPAFMRATELGKAVAISGSSFPVATKMDDLLPISFPPIFMQMSKKKTPDDIVNSSWTEFLSRKDKTQYMVKFDKGMLAQQQRKEVDSSQYAPNQSARFCDVPAMVTIARVFSSFLRTHKYPAFADDDHFEEVRREDQIGSFKHNLADEELDQPEKRRIRVEISNGDVVHGFSEKDDKTSSPLRPNKIVFSKAKPVTSLQAAWGSTHLLPQTHGIHFPYVRELAKPDKDVVPRVIERFFLRALSTDNEKCLKTFGEITQSWKSSLCTTTWGHEMSHLARIIELAIPSQSRVYPIVDANCYFGSFLSGAGFSVAQGKNLYRPDTYKNCLTEISAYSENGSLISEICALAMGSSVDENTLANVAGASKRSVRALSNVLENEISFDAEEKEKMVNLVSKLRFPQIPWVINANNMIKAMRGIMSGEHPDSSEPMYPSDMFATDIFTSYLSCFGVNKPSPNLPGAPQMKLVGLLPDKFNKVLGVRLVDTETAVREWKKSLLSGVITNGLENLAAKYEHSAISGKEQKEQWFSTAVEFSGWWQKNEKRVPEVADVAEGADDGVVVFVGEGFDFADF